MRSIQADLDFTDAAGLDEPLRVALTGPAADPFVRRGLPRHLLEAFADPFTDTESQPDSVSVMATIVALPDPVDRLARCL
jgi:hypothetical protein